MSLLRWGQMQAVFLLHSTSYTVARLRGNFFLVVLYNHLQNGPTSLQKQLWAARSGHVLLERERESCHQVTRL
jgi:hypothetical protein